MNILDFLKRRHEEQKNPEQLLIVKRRQRNTPLTDKIVKQLLKLKAEFAVPRYAIFEHVVEIGIFYAFRILKSPEKKELVREHLIDKHVLDCGYDDPEELLRIGEGRYAYELISMARDVRRDLRVLGRANADTKRTGNLDIAEKAYENLVKSAVRLADWLSRHPLDEMNDNQDENSKR